MSLAIISADTIQKKLSAISRTLGVILRYRVFEINNGGKMTYMHTVSRAYGSKWVDITDPVKTQRVLWKRVTIWEELADAVRRVKAEQRSDVMEDQLSKGEYPDGKTVPQNRP